MARLHSRKKGKSGTRMPKSKVKPDWAGIGKKEMEEIIAKMAKEGMPPAKIGLLLRDMYGIPSVYPFLGMRLSAFLKKNGLAAQYPHDFLDLIKKAVRINKHLKSSKKDVHNRTKYLHVVSKINRLAKYLKKQKVLPQDWKYDAEQAELLVK